MADDIDPTVLSTGTRTGTLSGARDHARSQVRSAPGDDVNESSAAADVPGRLLWSTHVAGGGYTSRVIPRGSILRIEDTVGDACVQLLVHHATRTAERLNVADTVKVQWQAYLTVGALLLSDMGRAMMTIVEDTSTGHDCMCGGSTRAANDARYGDGGASGAHPSARDLLALGVAKFGLARVDVGPCISLFAPVRVSGDGTVVLDAAPRQPAHVDLRAEMDVLVTLANTPHPLDDRHDYTASPVHCVAWLPDASVPPSADPFRSTSPERERAFQNTDDLLGDVVLTAQLPGDQR